MSKNIPPEIKKKFEEHRRIAQSPLGFNSWLDLYEKNKSYAQIEKIKNLSKKEEVIEKVVIKKEKVEPAKSKFSKYVVCRTCKVKKHKTYFPTEPTERGHRLTCKKCKYNQEKARLAKIKNQNRSLE